MLFKQEYGKKNILLLRWILIIIVSNILLFNYPRPSSYLSPIFFIPFYVVTNIILSLCPLAWFKKPPFISLILLLDVILTTLALSLAIHDDPLFYVVFFLILLVASASRQARLIYYAFGLIVIVYGFSLYLKSPKAFWETKSLLRFPLIFVVTFFFHGMVESYNRIFREKEVLQEDYRELEVLTEVAQSIEQDRNLPKFLLTLTQILTDKLELKRCTAIFMDQKEEIGYMVSSNDNPEKGPLLLELKNYPVLRESLKSEGATGEYGELPSLPESPSRYILKTIPLTFRQKALGTLYLRASTPQRQLTHREQFFLDRLAHITGMAINNFRMDQTVRKSSAF